MFELKPEHIVVRDEVTAAAGTLAERLDVLHELHLHDDRLQRTVARATEVLAGALDRLLECRRADGDLPDAGQREAAQIGAVGLRMKTLFSEDTEAHVVAADLIEHCDDLLAKVDRARAFAGASAAVDDAMAVMREAAGQVRQAFQALC
jgi:hypothetical protein